MSRNLILLFLAILFTIAVSTPQACNNGANGNALSFHEDAEGDKFDATEDNQQTLPIEERFMFDEKFVTPQKKARKHVNPFPKNPMAKAVKQAKKFNILPLLTKPGEKFNRIHTPKIQKKPKVGQVKSGIKGKKNPIKHVVNKTIGKKGLLDGKTIITAGKIQFVELDQRMREQCLKDYFFCSVSCADDFKMSCSPAAQIFSTFVTRDQHARICVQPRVNQVNRQFLPANKRVEARKQCVLRPCGCKAYESQFIKLYGKLEFDRALKILQGMCFKWCTTGKKPAGVIDKNQANETIESVKQALLAAYRKFYAWMGKFLDFGKVAFDKTKKAAIFVGKNIKKGAEIAGRGIKKGAKFIGTNAKKIGKKVGTAFKGFGQKTGRAFRGFGKKAGRAFKGFGRKTGRAFRSAARRVGRFFRRFRRW